MGSFRYGDFSVWGVFFYFLQQIYFSDPAKKVAGDFRPNDGDFIFSASTYCRDEAMITQTKEYEHNAKGLNAKRSFERSEKLTEIRNVNYSNTLESACGDLE